MLGKLVGTMLSKACKMNSKSVDFQVTNNSTLFLFRSDLSCFPKKPKRYESTKRGDRSSRPGSSSSSLVGFLMNRYEKHVCSIIAIQPF